MAADHPDGGSNGVGATDGAPVRRPYAPRRPWLAFVLALLAPGLGHLYAGMPLRGVLAFAIWTCVLFGTEVFSFIVATFLGSPMSLAIGGLVMLPLLFAVQIDAAVIAWRRRHAGRTRWHRWWWYLAYSVAALTLTSSAPFERALWRIYDALNRVPDSSGFRASR